LFIIDKYLIDVNARYSRIQARLKKRHSSPSRPAFISFDLQSFSGQGVDRGGNGLSSHVHGQLLRGFYNPFRRHVVFSVVAEKPFGLGSIHFISIFFSDGLKAPATSALSGILHSFYDGSSSF